MVNITSTSNQLVQKVRSLKDKEARNLLNQFILEGENIVKDTESSLVDYLFVEQSKIDDYKYILEKYPQDTVFEVPSKVMDVLSDTKTPSGILAVAKKPQVKAPNGESVVVLDGVSDPGNMGTIIRTCVACGVKDIYAINTVDAFSPKVVRSTMGGIFEVNIIPTTYEELLTKLQGYDLLTLDMNGKDIFRENIVKKPFALIVGSEAHGVSKILKEKCTQILSLPMVGKIESLNAAVSLSVALYTLTFSK